MTREKILEKMCPYLVVDCELTNCESCNELLDKWFDKYDEQIMQEFAQWLWNNHYLTDEAFNIRLVEQYKIEKLKEQK